MRGGGGRTGQAGEERGVTERVKIAVGGGRRRELERNVGREQKSVWERCVWERVCGKDVCPRDIWERWI